MRMRLLAAAAVLVSAAVHLYLWFEGYREVDVIGPAFLLNVVAGAGIAVLLVGWRHWSRRCWPSASGSRRSGPSSSPRRSGSSASRSRGPAGRSGLLPHPRWSRPGRAPCSCCGATRWVQVVSRSTTRPSAVRTSIDASSSRLAAVAAVTSIGRPSTDRQLPTRSARPSRVRTNNM